MTLPPHQNDTYIDEVTGRHRLRQPFLERVETLIRELERIPDGFIRMNRWVDPSVIRLPEARSDAEANPCGTACCLAGKAGLMKVFQDQGFSWNFTRFYRENLLAPVLDFNHSETVFTTPPYVFFGTTLHHAVFVGSWCIDHLRTPGDAVEVLQDFLGDVEAARIYSADWKPANQELRSRLVEARRDTALAGSRWTPASFPVSDKAASMFRQAKLKLQAELTRDAQQLTE